MILTMSVVEVLCCLRRFIKASLGFMALACVIDYIQEIVSLDLAMHTLNHKLTNFPHTHGEFSCLEAAQCLVSNLGFGCEVSTEP